MKIVVYLADGVQKQDTGSTDVTAEAASDCQESTCIREFSFVSLEHNITYSFT